MQDNFWRKIKKPIIGLAPLAGITDSSFRIIAKEWGADLVYSEMVSSHGLAYGGKKSFDLCRFKPVERPIIIQIFGREPQVMAEAAAIIEKKIKPDGIDINFGCPARRVVSSGHGAALMDEPKLAADIAQKVCRTISLPLSVKTRLGSKNKDEIFDFAKRMESAGVKAIAVHGRTLKQGFKGNSDWRPIYKLKDKTKMYVLGNGDIKSRNDIELKLGNLDGILIGRGALGNPFIFRGGDRIDTKTIFAVALKQAKIAEKEKGKRGLIEMRKHLSAYFKGMPKAKQLRQELVRVETIEDIKNILSKKLKIKTKNHN